MTIACYKTDFNRCKDLKMEPTAFPVLGIEFTINRVYKYLQILDFKSR